MAKPCYGKRRFSYTFLAIKGADMRLTEQEQQEIIRFWEHLNNPGSNPIEFEGIRKQAGR